MAELLEPFKHQPGMKMRKTKLLAISVSAVCPLQPLTAAAQVISNVNLNEFVLAGNDGILSPPQGYTATTYVTDTTVPFQKTVSANDGTGSMITGTFGLTDNGKVATYTTSASGIFTAHDNDFAAGRNNPPGSTFQLLQPASYTILVTCNGSSGISNETGAEFDLLQSNGVPINGAGASETFPTSSVSGMLGPGFYSLDDSFSSGFNAAGYPASASANYSATFTLTAIPEPSSACLIGIPVIASLLRRRRRVRLVPESA